MAQERQSETSLSIVKNKDGNLVFEGTRMFISLIVGRAKVIGDFDEAKKEFVDGYPWLTASHFDAAMNYYHEHQEEVDRAIERNNKMGALLDRYADSVTRVVDTDDIEKDPEYQLFRSA